MTVEDLMKPRFKVIADYPLSCLSIGDVLLYEKHLPVIQGGYWLVDIDLYPHLFRRLEWWEDRKPEEMPEYIKFNYPFSPSVQVKEYNDTFDILAGTKMITKYLPATKVEYDQFTQNK